MGWNGGQMPEAVRFPHEPDPMTERMKMQMVKHAAEQAVILIPSLEPDG